MPCVRHRKRRRRQKAILKNRPLRWQAHRSPRKNSSGRIGHPSARSRGCNHQPAGMKSCEMRCPVTRPAGAMPSAAALRRRRMGRPPKDSAGLNAALGRKFLQNSRMLVPHQLDGGTSQAIGGHVGSRRKGSRHCCRPGVQRRRCQRCSGAVRLEAPSPCGRPSSVPA
jgi:hypothetical protein